MDPLVGAEGPAGVAGAVGGVTGGIPGGYYSYVYVVDIGIGDFTHPRGTVRALP